jgi:tripartite-type tricarboxylate transporter receptor subunit TctC
MLSRRDWFTKALALGGALGLGGQAHSQEDYPSRTITIVVPFGPGGIADLTARAVAKALTDDLGQRVIVDNRPSAGGIVGTAAVAQAKPDGYTLLLMSNANAVSASLFGKLPYDTLTSFEPVSMLGTFGLGVFVIDKSPVKKPDDLAALAKTRPGRLSFGTIAVGSTQNLAAELFKVQQGLDVVVVPYKTTPQVVTALRAGEIDAAFEIVGPMLGHVQSGDVRCLAVTSLQRHVSLPNIPTAIESGLSGYEVTSWNALAAPAGTPRSVVGRLNASVRKALMDEDLKSQLVKLGLTAQTSTPQVLRQHLQQEVRRWAEVIRAAKIQQQGS